MFVENVNHRIPKRKSDENSKEKHNKTTVREQDRHNSRNEHQNKMILKSLNAYFEWLKIIKPFEENQRRDKQRHRNPKQNENRQKITDDTPS